MNHSDIAALMKGAAPVIRDYVAGAVQPLLLQIEAMRKEIDALKSAPAPKDGKDADVDEIAALAAAALLPDIISVRGMVEALPAPVELPDIPAMIADAIQAAKPEPIDVKAMVEESILLKVDPQIAALAADVQALNPQIEAIGGAIGEEIAEHVGKAIAAIPPAVTSDDVKQMVTDAVAALPPAEKGKDADPVEVAAQIAAEVERAVAALPVPQDGKSVTVEDLRPMIDEAVTKAVTLIPVPKDGRDGRDGLDVVKFIRDDKGHLNGILRDGTTVDLGEYVGKDGAPGINGKDGRDGVSYDGIEEEMEDGGRFLVRRHKLNGEVVSEKRHLLATVIYRGVFREGHEYQRGDTVSYGGSTWHCDEPTTEKPDKIGDKKWTLAAKRGRDGKDGSMKTPPKPGPVKVG